PPVCAVVSAKDTTACNKFPWSVPHTQTHHPPRDRASAPPAIVSRLTPTRACRQSSHSKFWSSVQSLYEPRSPVEISETQSNSLSVSSARIQREISPVRISQRECSEGEHPSL